MTTLTSIHAGLIFSGLVAIALVLVYVAREVYGSSCESITNIDAAEFWQDIHFQLGLSLLCFQAHFSDACSSNLSQSLRATCDYDGEDEHDPRVIPALWISRALSEIHNLQRGQNLTDVPLGLISDFPFLWKSFMGLYSSHEFCSHSELYTDCLSLKPKLANFSNGFAPGVTRSTCEGGELLEILGPMDIPLSERSRKYVGANYLYHSKNVPSKLVILSLDSTTRSSLVEFNVTQVPARDLLAVMINDHQERYPGTLHISIVDQLGQFRSLIKNTKAQHTMNSELPLRGPDLKSNTSLTTNEFDTSVVVSDFEMADIVPAQDFSSKDFGHPRKYFHEAILSDTHVGYHYDWRFFKTTRYSTYERVFILHRLAKAWLRFSQRAKLKTWLAHGTLLGWYWNGMNLPWDQDVDVQITYESLHKLAHSFNQTLVLDLTDDPDVAGVHLYFIDVSPHYNNRAYDDNQNVIDARFIDTGTGMYVDITALAIGTSLYSAEIRNESNDAGRIHKVFRPDYTDIVKSVELLPTTMMEQMNKALEKQEEESWRNRTLYNCKDLHFYQLNELSPLRQTFFEGEVAYVPNDFKAVLEREYPKGLSSRVYGDWIYRPFFGVWTLLSECRSDLYGDECQDQNMVLEKHFTSLYRLKRGHWFDPVRSVSRVDPYIIRRNKALRSLKKNAMNTCSSFFSKFLCRLFCTY